MSDDIGLPDYWDYYDTTFKLESGPDGEWIGSTLSLKTGLFERDDKPTMECIFATSTSYISRKSYADFVIHSEQLREYHLTGDGPIFALYDTIIAMREQAISEGRRFTIEEVALIKSIHRRTFGMWEDEQRRREAGEPPTFDARPRR